MWKTISFLSAMKTSCTVSFEHFFQVALYFHNYLLITFILCFSSIMQFGGINWFPGDFPSRHWSTFRRPAESSGFLHSQGNRVCHNAPYRFADSWKRGLVNSDSFCLSLNILKYISSDYEQFRHRNEHTNFIAEKGIEIAFTYQPVIYE